MQAIGGFEEELRRRLQAELDAVSIRLPPPRLPRRRPLGGYYLVARPLAVAVVAALALGVLAISVTGSPDPGQWFQPGVWMRALGVAPPSPQATPSPSAQPSPAEEPSQSPEPSESSHPGSPEPEPSDHANGSPEPRESGGPSRGEGPDG